MQSRYRFGDSLACWGAVLGLALAVGGCSQGGNQPTQVDLARVSLKAALDSWKAGQRPEELKRRSPSIIVGDLAWEAGEQLASYEIVGPEFDDGANLHCPVNLVLKDSQGSEHTRQVTYIVGTSPVITVFPKQ